MINLIPAKEKKRIAQDFYLRLFTLFFYVIGVSILIASVALLPSYFVSSVKKNYAEVKLEMQKREPIPEFSRETLSSVQELESQLDLIENARENKFVVSQKIINEIILKKLPDVRINQILYENDPVKDKKISIRGTAPSRDRLLLFRRALEDSGLFAKVDLPISNFVKGSNIQFYLTLMLSLPDGQAS